MRRLGCSFSGTLEAVPGARIWIISREESVRRTLRIAVPSWPLAPKRAIVGIFLVFLAEIGFGLLCDIDVYCCIAPYVMYTQVELPVSDYILVVML